MRYGDKGTTFELIMWRHSAEFLSEAKVSYLPKLHQPFLLNWENVRAYSCPYITCFTLMESFFLVCLRHSFSPFFMQNVATTIYHPAFNLCAWCQSTASWHAIFLVYYLAWFHHKYKLVCLLMSKMYNS